jgi:hypothetical protein
MAPHGDVTMWISQRTKDKERSKLATSPWCPLSTWQGCRRLACVAKCGCVGSRRGERGRERCTSSRRRRRRRRSSRLSRSARRKRRREFCEPPQRARTLTIIVMILLTCNVLLSGTSVPSLWLRLFVVAGLCAWRHLTLSETGRRAKRRELFRCQALGTALLGFGGVGLFIFFHRLHPRQLFAPPLHTAGLAPLCTPPQACRLPVVVSCVHNGVLSAVDADVRTREDDPLRVHPPRSRLARCYLLKRVS